MRRHPTRVAGANGFGRRHAIAAAFAAVAATPAAQAFEIDTGVPELKARWDNTVKLSGAWRLKSPAPGLTECASCANLDDGDRNFGRRGIVSERFDLFSEFDASWNNDHGLRLSGAGWYDAVYNRGNRNDSPETANAFSAPSNEFTTATRNLHGRQAELLDAFAFGRFGVGDTRVSWRLGRHGLLWGESLFYGANGIAGGMAPTDVVKLLSVPNAQFKEVVRPVPQLSAQVQFTPEIAVGAYYQFRWEGNRLPAAGSYFSTSDTFDKGGERLVTGAPLVPGGGAAAFFRAGDIKPRDSGQGGLQLRWRPTGLDTDFGLYAIRYHDRNPNLYLRPGVTTVNGVPVVLDPTIFNPATGQIGVYDAAYAQGVRAFGASFSTSIDDFNLAGEASMRRNAPLVSNAAAILPGVLADASHPLFAVGNTAHLQFSTIASFGPSFIAREASLAAEIAWNRVLSVTANADHLSPNASRDGLGMRVVYEPSYRQVLPGVDLSVPAGISWSPKGRSGAVPSFGAHRGGDMNLGLAGSYLDAWRFSLTWTHYYGGLGPFLDAASDYSFGQSLKDRDYLALSLRRSF
ncbi:DUF1302 domain-containing protein [Derxia gummosa]|uniref:DUF1302 domain-containing protein n=1 Tax=Derxia gummosa DSM 723 TaxID=1121388 RepID=A0A8B6XA06_9BURK|nr:DUF1302 domain-containing protein [Derxia gummosa]